LDISVTAKIYIPLTHPDTHTTYKLKLSENPSYPMTFSLPLYH